MVCGGDPQEKIEKDEHACTLPPKEDTLVTFINHGRFVMARRRIKKFLMIDENGRYTRDCFKSTFLIEREKMYHLKHHYYMVHPFSKAKEYYDILVAVTLFVSVIAIKSDDGKLMQNNVFNAILLIDMIRTFFTGRYRESFNDTVLNPTKVAKTYLRGWFVVDFLAVIPNYMQMAQNYLVSRGYMEPTDFFIIVYFFQFARVIKYFHLANVIRNYRGYGTTLFKPIRMMSVTIMVIMWISYALYFLALYEREPFLEGAVDHYLNVVSRSFALFFLYGTVGKPAQNEWVLAVEVVMINLGYFFFMYMSVEFIQMTYVHLATSNKNESVRARLHLLADYRNLPDAHKRSLLQSLEFTFHRTYFNEQAILGTITGQLKREIMEFYAETFAKRVNVFESIPLDRMVDILAKMRVKLYQKNEPIVCTVDRRSYLQCVYVGTAAVYTQRGKEVRHLYDGDYFGTEDKEEMRETVTAVELCKVYRVTFQHLRHYLMEMPAVYDAIAKVARHNLRKAV